jgi:hypothetical protein
MASVISSRIAALVREDQTAFVVAKIDILDEPFVAEVVDMPWSISRSCQGTTPKAPRAVRLWLSAPFSS